MIRHTNLTNKWPKVDLASTVEILDHLRKPVTAQDRQTGPYPYYGANGQQDSVNNFIFDEPLVLVAEDGGHFGNPNKTIAYKVNGKCWVNNHAHVLRPKSCIDINYLCRHLEKYDVAPFINGATRQKLNKSSLKKIPILLPPLEQQKRIAAILDQADALRQKDQQLIDHYTQLSQSLFIEMFGDPVINPMGWDSSTWSDCIEIRNGRSQKKVECENGIYPIMGSGGLMGRANAYISDKNSIILGRKGNINKPILVQEQYWNVDTAFGLHAKEELLNFRYLYYFCKRYNFEQHNKTVTIPSLTKTTLQTINIPLPPIELQNQFAERIEAIEQLKQSAQTSLEKSTDLFNALLQKAFTGDLIN